MTVKFGLIGMAIANCLSIWLMSVLTLTGQQLYSSSLTSRSPFIPSGFQADNGSLPQQAVAVSNSDLKFKGVYQMGDSYFFLIGSDKTQAKWMELGEFEDAIRVKKFEVEDNRVLVEYNNQPVWLELVEAAAFLGVNSVQSTREALQSTRNSQITQPISSRRIITNRTVAGNSAFSRTERIIPGQSAVAGMSTAIRSPSFSPLVSSRNSPEKVVPSKAPPPMPVDNTSSPPQDIPTFIPEGPNMQDPVDSPFN